MKEPIKSVQPIKSSGACSQSNLDAIENQLKADEQNVFFEFSLRRLENNRFVGKSFRRLANWVSVTVTGKNRRIGVECAGSELARLNGELTLEPKDYADNKIHFQ